MLNLDIRVLLDQYAVSAGDTLTGTIFLTPPRASPSSSAILTSLNLTAKCAVKAEFQDHSSTWRTSITHPYLIEKSLIHHPTSLSSSETSIRFSLTLPITSRTPNTNTPTWTSSPRFAHSAPHPIPASFGDSIHHTLTITATTSSRLFSVSKREIYYQFLATRSQLSPSPNFKSDHQSIRSQPVRGWRKTFESLTLANPSHNPGFPATGTLQASLPTTLVVGQPLSIKLDASYNENHKLGAPMLLSGFTLRLIARYHARAKVVPRRSSISKSAPVINTNAETEQTQVERVELASYIAGDAARTLDEGFKVELQDMMETNLLEAAEVVPGFKTWNAALRYALELEVVVAVGGRKSLLIFRRNVEVLAGVYKAVREEEGLRQGGLENMEMLLEAVGQVEEAPPAYSDPPPEYVVAPMAVIAV